MGRNIIDLAGLIKTQDAFMIAYYNYIGKVGKMFNLNEKETDVLSFYINFPQYDTQADVVKYRGYSKTQASKIITSLMSYGYLNAHEDSEDARVLHISITDKARELGLLLHANKSDFYTKALKGFSEEEIAQIDSYINRINANLGCNK